MLKKGRRAANKSPENETKSARFIQVVTPRVRKAVKGIKLISNCVGMNYDYTPHQAKQITGVLMSAISSLESSFLAKTAADDGFTFTDK